jgi:hypothetical protein
MFDLDKEQSIKYNEWTKGHDKVCKFTQPGASAGAIGGRLTFEFTPTGLGTIVRVKCACGEEVDLTDYDW